MKFVALISGGKDSIYSICKLLDEKNTLVKLVYMNNSSEYTDSYMFQTVGIEAIDFMSEALNVPLFKFETKCRPVNIQMEYFPT